MRTFRTSLLAFAVVAGFSTLGGSAPASATDWSWLGNKPYMNCLKLFYTGNFLMPAGLSQSQQDAYHEKGRRYCNRTYYGHD